MHKEQHTIDTLEQKVLEHANLIMDKYFEVDSAPPIARSASEPGDLLEHAPPEESVNTIVHSENKIPNSSMSQNTFKKTDDFASTNTPEGSGVLSTDDVLHAEEVMCDLPARQGNVDRHFVVKTTILGDSCDSLIDTGATISACKPERARAWARKGSTVSKLRPCYLYSWRTEAL